MKNIFDFLSSTNLNAGQQIVVSVTSAFIMVILVPIFIKSCKSIFIKLKDKYKRYIRLKKGKLSSREYLNLQKRVNNGQMLSKNEMEAYKKVNLEFKESIRKAGDTIKKAINEFDYTK